MNISIIIINYNTYHYTCNCIQSILEHTQQVSFEIILVDNASIECDPQIFKDKFPFITLIKSNENGGFAKGNNLGIEAANGDYILLLNSDTELIEDCISKTYHFAKTKKNLGAITCKLVNDDRYTKQDAGNVFPNVKLLFFELTRFNKIFKNKYKSYLPKYNFDTTFEIDCIWGTFFMFPKKNLSVLGGKLTETFFMYCEDLEWCFLFNKSGLKNYYFADTKIVHHLSKSTNTTQKLKSIKTNFAKFIELYYPKKEKLIFKTLYLIDYYIYKLKTWLSKTKK